MTMLIVALTIVSILFAVACGAIFLLIISLRNTFQRLDASEAAYHECIAVVGGPLFSYLERLKKADVSLIYVGEVAELYRHLLASHAHIYDIMSRHQLLTSGEPMPPYILESRVKMERQYIHAKVKAEEQSPQLRGNAQVLGIAGPAVPQKM